MFARVSFDLIYARPGQTLADWRAELREALAVYTDSRLRLYAVLDTLEYVQRGGRIRLQSGPSATKEALHAFIARNVADNCERIYTDVASGAKTGASSSMTDGTNTLPA